MKRILVPVDFSDNSKNALDYAQELALYFDAEIKVIHIMHPAVPPEQPYAMYNFDEDIEKRKKELSDFVQQHQHKEVVGMLTQSKIDTEVIIGLAGDKILQVVEDNNSDLIVMGSTGAGGMGNALFGSVSLSISQHAKCPVLLIPKDYHFKDFKNILYATDAISSRSDLLKDIVDLSSLFSADIHVVHVQSNHELHEFELEESIMDQIKQTDELDTTVKFVTILDDDIWHGLNVYSKENTIDLMIMVRSKRNFWVKLLGSSMTKKMAKNATRPILIYPSRQ